MGEQERDETVDYRKMYYHMAGEVESAIRVLIKAQQECEEMLLNEEVPSKETGG